MKISNLKTIGDLLAVMGFLLLIIYFSNKKEKTTFEKGLLAFSIIGFSVDLLFTLNELNMCFDK